jgi:hypothetical protein
MFNIPGQSLPNEMIDDEAKLQIFLNRIQKGDAPAVLLGKLHIPAVFTVEQGLSIMIFDHEGEESMHIGFMKNHPNHVPSNVEVLPDRTLIDLTKVKDRNGDFFYVCDYHAPNTILSAIGGLFFSAFLYSGQTPRLQISRLDLAKVRERKMKYARAG